MDQGVSFSQLQPNCSRPKKNGDLRLCADFREFNNRTVIDRHPLPSLRTTLYNLGDNSWFSMVDQGKANHQGYMDQSAQHLTFYA